MKSTKQKKNTKTKVIINDFECPKNLLSPKIRTMTWHRKTIVSLGKKCGMTQQGLFIGWGVSFYNQLFFTPLVYTNFFFKDPVSASPYVLSSQAFCRIFPTLNPPLPWVSPKQDITSCSKTKQPPIYEGYTTWSSMRSRVPKASTRDSPCSHC